MLYPLKFIPVYKDYIWGGRNLEKLDRVLPAGIVAESWEISCHPDGVSVIANGEFAGMSLPDYLHRFGAKAIGTALPAEYVERFPLLIKLIDANQKLSVQVHPDDDYARVHENGERGKNEMWYVIAAEPDARIIYDIIPGTTREDFARAVAEGRVESCLKTVEVAPGDVIDIPAGVVHGLGAGIVLVEIQQSSNLTYRIYDYDRVDADGKKRPLHIDKALDVIDFRSAGREPKRTAIKETLPQGSRARLIRNEYFSVDLWELDGELPESAGGERFFIYTVIEGEGSIRHSGGVLRAARGETIFIPASLGDFILTGRLKYLQTYIQPATEPA